MGGVVVEVGGGVAEEGGVGGRWWQRTRVLVSILGAKFYRAPHFAAIGNLDASSKKRLAWTPMSADGGAQYHERIC